MTIDVAVAHEARFVRVTVRGDPGLGRLLSLLQVLEVDSASWAEDAVLVDLREVRTPLSDDEQLRLAGEVVRALRRLNRVALAARAGRMRESPGLRVFTDAAAAAQWLAEPN